MEQGVELDAVAARERGIERACEVGRITAFHPFGPLLQAPL